MTCIAMILRNYSYVKESYAEIKLVQSGTRRIWYAFLILRYAYIN